MFKDEALSRMMKYCAYQERSHTEVRNKLLKLEVYGEVLESIMSELITEGFLNEERFARSYVRGKFKNNKWGRNKILEGLRYRKISPYCIKKGLTEIDDEDYRTVLKDILQKKQLLLSESNKYAAYKKLSQYALQRGFEYDAIKDVLTEILDSQD